MRSRMRNQGSHASPDHTGCRPPLNETRARDQKATRSIDEVVGIRMKINATMSAVFVLCSFSLSALPGCNDSENDTTSSSAEYRRVPFPGVRCSIELLDSVWSAKKPAVVHVKLQNETNERIQLLVRPSFRIRQTDAIEIDRYWCPTTLDEHAEPLGANRHFLLSLNKGETIDSVADVSQLGWDFGVSSIWPAKNLFDLLDPREYRIHLEMSVRGSKNTWIESNLVSFRIVESVTGPEVEEPTEGSATAQ